MKQVMDILYKDESYSIMGACFEVYKEMGCGMKENVNHECLEREFRSKQLPAVHEPKVELAYKLGLLVNFGHYPRLEWERIVLDTFNPTPTPEPSPHLQS